MISAFPRLQTLPQHRFASGGRRAPPGSTSARAAGRCSPSHRGFQQSQPPRLKPDRCFVREEENHTPRF